MSASWAVICASVEEAQWRSAALEVRVRHGAVVGDGHDEGERRRTVQMVAEIDRGLPARRPEVVRRARTVRTRGGRRARLAALRLQRPRQRVAGTGRRGGARPPGGVPARPLKAAWGALARYCTRGNIDYGALADRPLTAWADVKGARVSSLHIAGPPGRPNAELRALVGEARPDLVVVGHSHVEGFWRVGGALVVNPGAAGHHSFHARRTAFTMARAAGADWQAWRIDLGPRGRARAASGSAL